MVFAIAFGLVDYATVPVTASLVASHLGLRVMGLAMGLIAAGHALGGAAGAYAGGWLVERLGSYDLLWWSSLALALLAGMMVLLLSEKANGSHALKEAASTP
jgi:predicted MFS family arabinose efflux permease